MYWLPSFPGNAGNLFMLLASLAMTSHAHESLIASADEATVVFLVRHAEKVDASRDPQLSMAGHQRAEALAVTLRDANIEQIHSSDYIRTRDTAAPLADLLNLPVQIYDAADLPAVAAALLQRGGRHLVVGHSNTTPVLVELLGGDGGVPIKEESEYDRLYVVTINSKGSASSVLLRFWR